MKDIHKLTDCINNNFKCSVVIIKKKNWKSQDFANQLLCNYILLFDTSEVGLGEFGERNKKKLHQIEWKNSIGIIQYIEDEVIITFIPKGIRYTESVIRPYLRRVNMCMICRSDKVLVKTDNVTGLVICRKCYYKCFGR